MQRFMAYLSRKPNIWKIQNEWNNFIDIVKEFGMSEPTILFKISIVKCVNKYPKMRKSSLSLHFLKNNFKLIKEIYHENASEFK